MQASRRNDALVLQFGPMEKQLLLQVVEAMLANYRLKPEEIDPKTADVWYSTRGCKSAGMSADETREWIDNLYSFKSANAKLLEQWVDEIKETAPDIFELAIKLEHASNLLTVINDHRLHLAAYHDIGQHEMDQRSVEDQLEEELDSDK